MYYRKIYIGNSWVGVPISSSMIFTIIRDLDLDNPKLKFDENERTEIAINKYMAEVVKRLKPMPPLYYDGSIINEKDDFPEVSSLFSKGRITPNLRPLRGSRLNLK